MAKRANGKLNSVLERALAAELVEITKKDAEGKFVHPTVERCRIIDRCLKWESVKQKVDSPEWGAEFKQD